MGVYVIRHLKESIKKLREGDNDMSLQIMANDFCANVKDSLKERLLFLNQLFSLEPHSDQFKNTCQNTLKTSKDLNPWYLPSLPSQVLTISDTCKSYEDLYYQIRQKDITHLDKSVQYSLLLTLELDFNSREERLFNDCIDSVVKQDPKRYCSDDIVSMTPFDIWTKDKIDNMCAGASTQVILDCSDGQCTPCADSISFMFTRYANTLDTATTKLYTLISAQQAELLQSSNNFNKINKQAKVDIDDISPIQLPSQSIQSKNETGKQQINAQHLDQFLK
ncbi:UNKNOWN [Stylonychia lemnae]|uniref:Uncharacterized protein n=1 Tax=Stylonychia lemnae TaxID=5949 RepID=A0A078B110_STYLE|nr:UNKNOWN [Stylonychia lemnae]|eukprot:CDW88021.1 UNKNOWN [Stylonychia lemnae]